MKRAASQLSDDPLCDTGRGDLPGPYQVLFDSDNDGIGDFRGLTSRLDYIAELGVNTVWLLPFYPSPAR
ncbi:alpha-amylase family glycosyl hydrolase [Komagataeibacter rhaeticus]|nr:alpha-amylase family glycosyl hydrolase [Komagataeibacter rhaeticus]